MDKVGLAANDRLKDAISECNFYASNRLLLKKFTHFYQSSLQNELAAFIRQIMPATFLVTTFSLAKTLSAAQDQGSL